MDNRPEYIITWLGLAKIGVAVAMINSNNKGKPLLHSIDIVDCSLVIFGSNQAELVEGVLDDLKLPLFVFEEKGVAAPHFATSMATALATFDDSPTPKSARDGVGLDDIFGYIYTSGTTGLPKACVIKHLKYMGSGAAFEAAYGVTNDERLYTVLPLYHSAGGMLGAGCMVTTGVTLILARKFSASKFMEECAKYDADVTQYIGELCRYLINSKPSPFDQKHHLRIAIGNGLRREIWPGFCERFNIPEIGEFYGATEGNVSFVNWSKNLEGYGSIGRTGWLIKKLLGFQIVKHDVATESPVRDPVTGFCIPCDFNEPGELLGFIKPNDPGSKFEGYSDPEATAKKILKDVMVAGDEYFRTGDLIRQDEEGFVYFVDRIGDTFRWKGENVSTNEVSEVVSVYPGVQEANVFGVQVPGNEDGRACMAAIVFDSAEIDFDALLAHINKDLASYAVPQFIRVLPEMEITGTFKHRKVEFVKEGFDISKCGGDPLYYLNSATKKYEPLDEAAYQRVITGEARL
jgi:fatty-acyl-CoA synthase